jgi:shikimate kinase
VSFRNREEAMLAELVARTGIVLATGGGVVIRAVNREHLKANGTVIYLHAHPSTVYHRVHASRNRPLLNTQDKLARLEELYRDRDALYREVADAVLDSDRGEIARFAARLEADQRGVLRA